MKTFVGNFFFIMLKKKKEEKKKINIYMLFRFASSIFSYIYLINMALKHFF